MLFLRFSGTSFLSFFSLTVDGKYRCVAVSPVLSLQRKKICQFIWFKSQEMKKFDWHPLRLDQCKVMIQLIQVKVWPLSYLFTPILRVRSHKTPQKWSKRRKTVGLRSNLLTFLYKSFITQFLRLLDREWWILFLALDWLLPRETDHGSISKILPLSCLSFAMATMVIHNHWKLSMFSQWSWPNFQGFPFLLAKLANLNSPVSFLASWEDYVKILIGLSCTMHIDAVPLKGPWQPTMIMHGLGATAMIQNTRIFFKKINIQVQENKIALQSSVYLFILHILVRQKWNNMLGYHRDIFRLFCKIFSSFRD